MKCFSQQEQLDSLQEQVDLERERAESKQLAAEKELALRVDQVRRSRSGGKASESGGNEWTIHVSIISK